MAAEGVATPRPASTVVLLRNRGQGGVEVFLVQRHGSMGFMGGMHVFPGGKVSEGDAAAAVRERVRDGGACTAEHAWGDDIDHDAAFARAVAAVRETFEEACVLLAPVSADLAALRAELLAGAGLAELLARERLSLALDALVPLSRWITPESEPTRFDTSFYLARLPEGQVADHDRGESVASLWATPSAALASAEAGAIRLAPPTARTLEHLLGLNDTEAALAAARHQKPPVILPILRVVGDEMLIVYPGDPEHPVRERALPGDTRRVFRRPAR